MKKKRTYGPTCWVGGSNRGSDNFKSKLDDDDVRMIREMYEGRFTQRMLANRFGVSQPQINAIVRGLAWTHVR